MKWNWGILFFLFFSMRVWAVEPFVVQDIQFVGLQRISLGTAFNYMPVNVGETVTDADITNTIRELYKTGFFEDLQVSRDGNVLVVHVQERPSIASIEITGNKKLKSDDLESSLDTLGLKEGRIFNRTLFDQIEQELLRQYFGLGLYGVKITTKLDQLERNRVGITIAIDEGAAAKIKLINIIGATSFPEDDLLDEFKLTTPGIFSFFTKSGQYTKEELLGDLEVLRSYYLDRGYLHFEIVSTQVSLTPDKRDVYININISEGEQYTVNEVKITGDLVVPAQELRTLFEINSGDIFSRRVITEANIKISERLGIDGYAFANVNVVPDINEEDKTVSLTFFVDPGRRVYVRRINVTGNTKTRDDVVRREIRQMEGGWLSTPLVDRSKVRLQKLGFFDTVNVETLPVPDTTDQVDLNVDVVEGSTGNFKAGVGYGDTQGVLFNTSVTLNNFMGTGKRLSAELNNSRVNTIYSFSYTNPYYTPEGVSRGVTVDYRETNADAANLASYYTDTLGAQVNYGIPISEFNRANLSIGYEHTDLEISSTGAPIYYSNWVAANGSTHDSLTVSASWSHDTRNRAIFPDQGSYSQIGMELGTPAGDLQFYKLFLNQRWYYDLTKKYIFVFGAELGYGGAYSGTTQLPFYKHYYAGGPSSVRGFVSNTLGPRDLSTNEPIGGTRKIVTHYELLLPIPLFGSEENSRVSVFVDVGNVFGHNEQIALGELRSSYGVAAVWMTPIGPLAFNFAWPIKAEAGDETEVFQFSIGLPF